MATEANADDDELRDISCIFGIFDSGVEDILAKIDTVSREEIERELTENFDKELLRNFRLKSFELAKEKAKRVTTDKGASGILDDALVEHQTDQSNALRQCIDQWETVKRRAKHKLVNDALSFLLYVLDANATFPVSVIRSASTDKITLEEEDSTEDITEQFYREVSNATEPVDIDVVYAEADKELHVITLPAVQVIDLGPIDDLLGIERDIVVDRPVPIENSASGGTTDSEGKKDPQSDAESTSVEHQSTKSSCSPKPISLPCTHCGHSLFSVNTVPPGKKDTGTSSADFRDYLKMMSERDNERAVSREEYEYHTDYIEQLAQEAVKKSKDIEIWQKRVEARVLRLEHSQVRKDERVLRVEQTVAKMDLDYTTHQKALHDRMEKLAILEHRPPDEEESDILCMERMRGPPVDAVSQRAPASDDRRRRVETKHESIWDMRIPVNTAPSGGARMKQAAVVEHDSGGVGHVRERVRRPSRVNLPPTPTKPYSRKPTTQPDRVKESEASGKRLLSPGILNFTAKPPTPAKADRPRSSSRLDERPGHPPTLFNGRSNHETTTESAGAFDVSGLSTSWYDDECNSEKHDSEESAIDNRSSLLREDATPKEQRPPKPTRSARKRTPSKHTEGDAERQPADRHTRTPSDGNAERQSDSRHARFPGEYERGNYDSRDSEGSARRDERMPNKGRYDPSMRDNGDKGDERDDRPFYNVVKKNAWKPQKPYQPSNKRKREWSGNKQVIELKAAPETEGKELFVEGLDYS